MEPRYKPRWHADVDGSVIGSCDRFDLWWDGSQDYLWVVWGPAADDWTVYRLDGGTLNREAIHNESGNPTDEELDLIEHYVFLFVPALGLKVSKLANVGV